MQGEVEGERGFETAGGRKVIGFELELVEQYELLPAAQELYTVIELAVFLSGYKMLNFDQAASSRTEGPVGAKEGTAPGGMPTW